MGMPLINASVELSGIAREVLAMLNDFELLLHNSGQTADATDVNNVKVKIEQALNETVIGIYERQHR